MKNLLSAKSPRKRRLSTTLVIVLISLSLVSACTPDTTPSPTSTGNPTGTNPPPSTTQPIPATIQFNFDTGVTISQSTPFNVTVDGVTARFSSPSDPGAFSIQNKGTTSINLASFSGNYLYPNRVFRTQLEILFDTAVKSVTIAFAITDAQGAANIENPSFLKATGFNDSVTTTAIVTNTSQGKFTGDTFPQGTITLDAGNSSFNLLLIEIVPQPNGGTGILVDNIIVNS